MSIYIYLLNNYSVVLNSLNNVPEFIAPLLIWLWIVVLDCHIFIFMFNPFVCISVFS